MPAQDPYVGTLFAGRFLIERLLDAGGMGAVRVPAIVNAKIGERERSDR